MTASLAVWKFASCDGCQLSLLGCEDELLTLADTINIAYFPEATRNMLEGPYTISLVEGSITTPEDEKRIARIRAESEIVVTIGACATAGGIQALKNYRDLDEITKAVYANPAFIDSLSTSTAIKDHIKVDYELRGCPVNKQQLLQLLIDLLHGRVPKFPHYSVCIECKRLNTTCVMVSDNQPCLGPITQAGCGALCPQYNRGCYGCFGPIDNPNVNALLTQFSQMGVEEETVRRLMRSFNAAAPEFYIDDTAPLRWEPK